MRDSRTMTNDYAFVIMQVGEKESPTRRRADEIYDYVIRPVLEQFNLAPYRSDLDPTPGQINPQLLSKLLEAQIVIADLTGRNPNVFYELGIVHSFAKPVVALADSAKLLPFDAHDERVIELGEHGESLSVSQAEDAKIGLRQSLEVVLSSTYEPFSPLADVAARRSLDELAPKNPIAAELTAIREGIAEVKNALQVRQRQSRSGDSPVTEQDVMSVEFTKAMRGYAMFEVDKFLDRLASEIGRKDNELAELRRKLAELESGPRSPDEMAE